MKKYVLFKSNRRYKVDYKTRSKLNFFNRSKSFQKFYQIVWFKGHCTNNFLIIMFYVRNLNRNSKTTQHSESEWMQSEFFWWTIHGTIVDSWTGWHCFTPTWTKKTNPQHKLIKISILKEKKFKGCNLVVIWTSFGRHDSVIKYDIIVLSKWGSRGEANVAYHYCEEV